VAMPRVRTTAASHESRGSGLEYLILVTGLVVFGFAINIAHLSEFPAETSVAIIAASPPVIRQYITRFKRLPDAKDLTAYQRDLRVRPIGVALALGGAYLVTDSLAGVVLLESSISGALAISIIIVIYAAIGFFAGRHASYYLTRNKLRWLALAVAIFAVLRLLIIAAFLGDVTKELPSLELGAITLASGCVLLVASSWFGAFWGRRSQEAFIGFRMLIYLPPRDRKAVVEMMQEEIAQIIQHKAQPNQHRPGL
jgi:hypothetical protein